MVGILLQFSNHGLYYSIRCFTTYLIYKRYRDEIFKNQLLLVNYLSLCNGYKFCGYSIKILKIFITD